jgi:hypothetical protein
MAAYDVSVNVVFQGGAEFDPPPPLGTTERTRYFKVRTMEEVEGRLMQSWLEQAGRTGLEVAPARVANRSLPPR